MAIIGLLSLATLWLIVNHILDNGLTWIGAIGAIIALDVGVELLVAAWRGRSPDTSLLFYLVP